MRLTSSPFAPQVTILGRASAVLLVATFLLGAASTSRAQVRVEAYAGEPMGVGRVTVQLRPGSTTAPLGDDRFTISDSAGRVLYPVAEQRRVREILRRFLQVETPRRLTYYFKFTGSEPLDLDLYTPDRQTIRVVPRSDPRGHHELVDEWWEAYVKLYQRVHNDAEYPVGVQTYLTSLWAQRLGRQMPMLEGSLLREQGQGGTVTGKLLADEAYRASVLRDLMLGRMDDAGEMVPLPPHGIRVTGLTAPQAEVEVETIATHVPEECFYIRFGTFTNYLWFRDFMSRWKGDLGNMLVLRSIRRSTSDLVSKQIALKETELARILGPQVISDVAIVGTDPYVGDGAAIGLIFQAKNNFLLAADFNKKRAAAQKEHDDATIDTVEIAGHKVSYLSTPDGTLRSYYAVDGDFHFVTTSRRMVERFYAAAEGEGTLAAAGDFLAARQAIPLANDDTVFVHLSQAFLHQLTSPAYRIELDRRIRSVESDRARMLAELAAAQEGATDLSISGLIAGGYLPESFDSRADGATWATDDRQRPYESQRGYAGRFIPIVDHLPEECSAAERRRYEQFAQSLASEAGGLVPLTATLFRETDESGHHERIYLDAHLAPYSATNLAPWAKKLGPATPLRVAPIAGDVVSGEVVLDGMLGGGEPFHLFGGIRDGHVPLAIRSGGVSVATSLTDAVDGYVGAWPKPQFLEQWLGRPRGPLDGDGIGRTGGLFDLWTRRADDFLLFSFKRHVLYDVGSQLAMVEAPPAQVRIFIADLAGSKYEPAANSYGYGRTRQTSASGSRFMNSLVEQLHVDKHDALPLANTLVNGEYVCPLGGEYVLVEIPGGIQAWTSTAVAPNNQFLMREVPGDYQLPLLSWFRGLSVEVIRGDDVLTLSALIDTTTVAGEAAYAQQRQAPAPEANAPPEFPAPRDRRRGIAPPPPPVPPQSRDRGSDPGRAPDDERSVLRGDAPVEELPAPPPAPER